MNVRILGLLSALACASTISAQIPDRAELAAADAKLVQHTIPATEYENAVTAAGGRVDFVFADDRPFASCHASTLAALDNGGLICAWFGGTREGADDVAIWTARFDGDRWSAPVRIAKVNDTAHWNPVLFTSGDNTLHLFFKVGPEIAEWQTWWMHSFDEGMSWTEPAELVPGDHGGRGPVRTKPIVLTDGTWLAGASTERGDWKSFADRSLDSGNTWTRSADFTFDRTRIKARGGIQPAVWESEPGQVHALIRTQAGIIARADSNDGGQTWSPVMPTTLPNNNSGIDVLRLNDRLYLLLNPVRRNWGPRTPLSLAVSGDNGQTWRITAHLEESADPDAEFSYPAIIRTGHGIAVSYTWNRDRIRVWQIPEEALSTPQGQL